MTSSTRTGLAGFVGPIAIAFLRSSAASPSARSLFACIRQRGAPSFTGSPTFTSLSIPTAGSTGSSARARARPKVQRGEGDPERVDIRDKARAGTRQLPAQPCLGQEQRVIRHPGIAALRLHHFPEFLERGCPRRCSSQARERACGPILGGPGEKEHLLADRKGDLHQVAEGPFPSGIRWIPQPPGIADRVAKRLVHGGQDGPRRLSHRPCHCRQRNRKLPRTRLLLHERPPAVLHVEDQKINGLRPASC